MSKRAHADEIIKWASDENAVVFCRSFDPTGESEWITLPDPHWSPEVQYKTILPEYAEAWQAWLDGELEVLSHKDEWVLFAKLPSFSNPPEFYRRKPKDLEPTGAEFCSCRYSGDCPLGKTGKAGSALRCTRKEIEDAGHVFVDPKEIYTELAELKAQHKLALEGWEREKNERMRLEEIAAEFDEQSKTNDHLSAMLKACKEEMERPTQRTKMSIPYKLTLNEASSAREFLQDVSKVLRSEEGSVLGNVPGKLRMIAGKLEEGRRVEELPPYATEQADGVDLPSAIPAGCTVTLPTSLSGSNETMEIKRGNHVDDLRKILAERDDQIADLRKENADIKKRLAEHKLTVQALDLECARQHASEEPNEEIEWPYRPEEYSFDEFLQKLIAARDDARSGNNGSPSVIDGLRKLLAERNEELKERDSELVEANARAEHWRRLASEKAVNPTSTCMHDLVKILCVLRDRGTDMVVTVTGSEKECRGLTYDTYNVVGVAEDLVSLYEFARSEVNRLVEEAEQTIKDRDAAEETADKIASLILGEPIDWSDHPDAWNRALEKVSV